MYTTEKIKFKNPQLKPQSAFLAYGYTDYIGLGCLNCYLQHDLLPPLYQ